MKDFSEAVFAMNKLALENNVSLQTFINTAKNSFNVNSEISVWVNDLSMLTHDLRYLKKLTVAVVDAGKCEELKEQTRMFKSVLGIDFEVDFRITNTALKIDMIEVWTNTKESDVWVDKVPSSNVSPGQVLYIPYDYYLMPNPVIFTDIESASKIEESRIIGIDNPDALINTLPYVKWIVPELKN